MDQENYAREILTEQMKQWWEGLTTEVICRLAGLPDVRSQFIGRKKVEEAMVNHHLIEIPKEMEAISKMNGIKNMDT